MNSYFKVILDDMGVKLQLFAAKDGGAPISIKELVSYLDRAKITYDLKSLNNEISTLTEDKIIFLSNQKIMPIRETAFIYTTPDKMSAIGRFYPASTNGHEYTKEDILSELRVNKIIYGMDEAEIDKFLADRKYCTDIVLAKGKPTREGHDAVITYNFPTDNKIRPTLKEDGSVDFFNLNILNHCKEGEVLAVLTPEDRGEPGNDVMGNIVRPHDVRRKTLSFGLNIELSEDKLSIRSKVNGHVSLVNGKVFVADVLEEENIDNSTGNIVYPGNVKINGNVCSNFSVKAEGNVEVNGIVEGAYIEAGGNIILARGMNGMGKGVLKAKGNVISKFLENCKVSAGGYVETESILHSEVEAGTEVNVVSKKGFITGGKVIATNLIRVKTLGSTMGANTDITVGINPSVISRYGELNKEVAETTKNLKMMIPVLEATSKKIAAGVKLNPEQVKNVQSLAASIKQLQQKLADDNGEMEALKEVMELGNDARVEVSGEAYGGTTITISDVSMIVKDSWSYCRFVKEQGCVKMKPL